MFVEHFIQKVPKALQISLYPREGSKLFTLERAVNNASWLPRSTTSNSDKLNQAPPASHGPTSIWMKPKRPDLPLTPCLQSKTSSPSSLWFLLRTSKCGERKWEYFKRLRIRALNGPQLLWNLNVFPRIRLHSILKASPCHLSPSELQSARLHTTISHQNRSKMGRKE